MTTFKTFLEARLTKYESEKVPFSVHDLQKMQKFLSGDYSDAWYTFLKNGKSIWRGHKIGDKKAVISKPSTGSRKSQNTANYYTIIFDNSPYFKDYPKRSKSFICHSSINRAGDYATDDRELCLVLPKNGSKIGICPQYDIWDTEVNFLKYKILLGDFYDTLDDFVSKELKSHTLDELKDSIGFGSLEEIIRYYAKNDIDLKLKLTNPKTKQYDIDLFFDYIFKQWEPEQTGFKLISTNQISSIPDEKEVWTDGDCLLLTYDYLEILEDAIKNEDI